MKQCPKCKDAPLVPHVKQDVEVEMCGRCEGIWLDRGELEKLRAPLLVEGKSPWVTGPGDAGAEDSDEAKRGSGEGRDHTHDDDDDDHHRRRRAKGWADRLEDLIEDLIDDVFD